jgi:hypothetical protein
VPKQERGADLLLLICMALKFYIFSATKLGKFRSFILHILKVFSSAPNKKINKTCGALFFMILNLKYANKMFTLVKIVLEFEALILNALYTFSFSNYLLLFMVITLLMSKLRNREKCMQL